MNKQSLPYGGLCLFMRHSGDYPFFRDQMVLMNRATAATSASRPDTIMTLPGGMVVKISMHAYYF